MSIPATTAARRIDRNTNGGVQKARRQGAKPTSIASLWVETGHTRLVDSVAAPIPKMPFDGSGFVFK